MAIVLSRRINLHMMEPENRIKRRVVNLGHVSQISTHSPMNRIVDIFQTSKCTRFVVFPGMIAECCKVLVVGIIHEDVDISLQGIKLGAQRSKHLILLCSGVWIGGVGGIPQGHWPFLELSHLLAYPVSCNCWQDQSIPVPPQVVQSHSSGWGGR